MPRAVITVAQMRAWENATWAAGQTAAAVIAKVGEIVAARARQLVEPHQHTLVLAGKGHNGDDARAAFNHLDPALTTLINVTDPETATPTLDDQLHRRPGLIIDGLFGIGLNRVLDRKWTEFLELVNQSAAPILAIDVPSGLNADSGEPMGASIRAFLTLTLGAVKAGLLRPEAIDYVGQMELAHNIGLAQFELNGDLQWMLPTDFDEFPPRRRPQTHKGSYGHLAIIAGSQGYHGAAVLSARAALRAQPGLVTVYTAADVYLPVASQLQAAMVHPWHAGVNLPENCTALAVGPGLAAANLSADLQGKIRHFWRELPVPMLVDASALDWLSPGPNPNPAPRLITPHPGEAARLLSTTPKSIQANRCSALRELAGRYGNCWVVLKGHQTLIGRSDGPIFVNSTGNPHLAQGGSGDVLTGFLGGLLAQPDLLRLVERSLNGRETTHSDNHPAALAIRYGVWRHGASADLLTQKERAWTAEDLASRIG